jgi:hypothetical protein
MKRLGIVNRDGIPAICLNSKRGIEHENEKIQKLSSHFRQLFLGFLETRRISDH